MFFSFDSGLKTLYVSKKDVFSLQVTPSQLPRGIKKMLGPVNMADVYRQSLLSPQNIFRERGRGNIFRERGRGGRMVLSERHKILRRCLEKAEGRRLFTGEGVSGESEAEEVMVGYGEEDEEEIEGSQSIGEPWDWGEKEGEELEEAVESERAQLCSRDEDELIVSPNLLVGGLIAQTYTHTHTHTHTHIHTRVHTHSLTHSHNRLLWSPGPLQTATSWKLMAGPVRRTAAVQHFIDVWTLPYCISNNYAHLSTPCAHAYKSIITGGRL